MGYEGAKGERVAAAVAALDVPTVLFAMVELSPNQEIQKQAAKISLKDGITERTIQKDKQADSPWETVCLLIFFAENIAKDFYSLVTG